MAGPLSRFFWTTYTAWDAWGDERLPFLPLERIQRIQNRRVAAMIRHAYDTVPHYREAMDAAGMRPADIVTAAGLASLPLIDGEELATAPQRFASSRYPNTKTVALRSSGTTGSPKTVHHSNASLFLALAHGQRQRAVMRQLIGRRFGYRELVAVRPDSVAHQVRAFYEAHSWVPRRLDLQRAYLSLDVDFEAAVGVINEFRPHSLVGYGSHLGALLRWAWEKGIELHRPQVVWYGADRMPDADRELIESRLGIPVLSGYQADEALRIGFQCELRQGFHLSVDQLAVTVVDPQGRPVAPGGTGEIVISNLTNRATVLLNYRLGDVVTLGAEPCPCGRSLPTITAIQGRADDLIALPGGEVRHALSLLQRLQSVPGVVQVQLLQEDLERFCLRAVAAGGADWAETLGALEALLREHLGERIRLRIEQVEAIPRSPGGKVKAVISRLKRGATAGRASVPARGAGPAKE